MKKISMKIILSLFLAFFFTTLIPRIIFRIIGYDNQNIGVITDNKLFIPLLLVVGLALGVFMMFVNAIVVKRVKAVKLAAEQVTKGNFDVFIPIKGKDEISQLGENFNLMVEELKSNEFFNKSFVSNFSHELKTPITAIKGYSDLIYEGGLSQEEIKDYSLTISQESERLANLAKNMIQISLLEASPITSQQDNFNVAEQIRTVLKLFNLEWEKKQIDMLVELSDQTITSNQELTYHIWKNLIDNAIKYTPNSSVIELALSDTEQEIEFSIKNEGVGLDQEQQSHIFDMFYTVNNPGSAKGSGIGLSIVKKIVEKLNGKIAVESDGSSFVKFIVKLKK
ncbi:MAG: ATP-binding protein [Bacilli bacterium]